MQGFELSPESARVRGGGSVLFSARAATTAQLRGLLVGERAGPAVPWSPAVGSVTIELITIHGVSLPVWRDVEEPQESGWPIVARVRVGQTIAVLVRNDRRDARELRAVIALDGGGGEPRRPRIAARKKR